MIDLTLLKRNKLAIVMVPVFSVLAACGGTNDDQQGATSFLAESSSHSADTGAVKPANYQSATVTADAAPSAQPTRLLAAATAVSASTAQAQVTELYQTLLGREPDAGGLAYWTNAVANGTPIEQVRATIMGSAEYINRQASATGARDPLKQPFASNSIWNMPIGTGAVYSAANLSGNPGNNIWAAMPGIDDEKLILKPSAPLTSINLSNAGWSGKNRCAATGGLLMTVPMPGNYIVPNTNKNSSATFLLADGRTIVQTQPLARCTANGPATSMAKFTNVDLYGPGITGAHGGSGLSAIGGSIRLGEMRPGSTTGPRHALKVNVYAKEALYKCTTRSACSRWPAPTSDSYAVGWYGSANGNSNTAMKMGALLAIPYSKSIASLALETKPAQQLAWTLQNYGAYIVDDTYAPGFDINVEDGPDGSVREQFKADWGFEMAAKVQGNTPWVRDMQKIVKALQVVNNNAATSIGGGGTPRQPLAPAIAP